MQCCVMELRKNRRYRLSAQPLFMSALRKGTSQNDKGVTRDINASGVHVLMDALPSVGALVQLDILLPKPEDPGYGMSLAGEDLVLRADPHGSQGVGLNAAGFAASVHFSPEETASTLSLLET